MNKKVGSVLFLGNQQNAGTVFSWRRKNEAVVLHKSKRRDEQTAENCKCRQCALLENAKSVGNVLCWRMQENVRIILYLRPL